MKWCLWVAVSLAFVVWEAKAQNCFDQVNVAFVIDGSSGLNTLEFDRVRELVINYARQKSTGNVHVGAVIVSGNVYGRQQVVPDVSQFEQYLRTLQFQAGAGIRTGTAIEVAFSDLITHQSVSNSKNVMIVLPSQQSLLASSTSSSAAFARDIGIEMYSVGLKNMPQDELERIAGSPNRVYRIRDVLATSVFPDIPLNLDGADCGDGPVTTPRPTTLRPTTPVPTTPQPSTQRPTTRQPTTPQPTTQRPTTQRPTTPQPTTQRPSTQRPTTQRPTTQRPTTQRPTTQGPTTQRPSTRRPTTQAPTTRRPTTQRPTQPSTRRPTTQRPTQPSTRPPTTVRPTTQRPTTRRPTTPSTTFRPLPTESLCQEARIIGTVGYRGHPTDPESYIQCYYPQAGDRKRRRRDTTTSEALMATNTVAVIRQCPYGLFWNQGTRTCELANLVTPDGDACSRQGLRSRPINGNCRAYFMCVNGRSVPNCCPVGQAYSPLGCIPCTTCMDNCAMASERTYACNRYPDWSDVYAFKAYQWDKDGGSYVKQNCPESCYFNLPTCDCAYRPWKTENDTAIPCAATIDIPFFSLVQNSAYRLENVNTNGGVANLNGNNAFIHVNLENYAEFVDYNGPLAIEFRYTEAVEITTRQALLSSTSCTQAGYLLVSIDRENILVEVSTELGTLVSLEVPTVGFKPGEWKNVRMVDNNGYITLSVSNGRDAYTTRATAPSSPYAECGLDIGKADFVNSFFGAIERFSLYQCIPDTFLG